MFSDGDTDGCRCKCLGAGEEGVAIFRLEWGWMDFAYHLAVTHHDGTVDIGLGKRHQGVEECYDLLAFYSCLLWGNTRKIAGLGFYREKPKGE